MYRGGGDGRRVSAAGQSGGDRRVVDRSLLGPLIAWDNLQTVGLWAVAVFKTCLWLMGVAVVWLTLWARRMAKR